ncbi:hypothetical protein A1O3_05983 [Capronia epimyces CBS 606.96]|uniref:Luciferase-like domain-containing protein n=1 Tax=Capronia epimyces CBS 606.96 TaxID=1182542 RepID=W9XYG8_9EURO|nr:uncharacterized protein A1O3_05983 [Capronia epimyces CBS 606.96]EXJ85308.1 hypothetical protein A1O3_05983 [Capronia epimyces CBS 606.96]
MEGRKQIQLNFIDNTSVGNSGCMGQWKDSKDQSSTKDRIEYYVELAKLAERGKITTIFFTDSYGNPETYEKSASAIFIGGGHVAHMDPLMFAGPMAMATTTVGITCTCTTSYIPPYILARSLSTVDHLTEGRLGWNVVTSFNSAAADAMGLEKMIPHDERYERAAEFMEVLYDLWEGSWEDGAQVFDKEQDMAYDPKKVHKVDHQGRYYKMKAYNHTHPSPQRTPTLFQAGASKAGIGFAAHHAEALFVHGTSPAYVRKQVDAVRQAAYEAGRDGSKIKFFMALLPTLGRTHEEAVAKHGKAQALAYSEGGVATISGFIGVDLSQYPLDEPFDFKAEASDSAIHGWINSIKAATADDTEGPWTPRKLGSMMGMGFGLTAPVGTAAEVADVMERWMDEADVDGFNVQQYVTGESFKDVVDLLVPELQRRGLYWDDYPVPGGTLRENLHGIKGQKLVKADHPAHQFKWNVRKTNHPSLWDLRQNGLELATKEKKKATTNGTT